MTEQDQPLWAFEIGVQGPFAMQGRWALEEVESFLPDSAFFQSIEVKAAPFGAQLSCKVFADTSLLAQQMAFHAIEQVIDVLGTQCNLPLTATLQEARPMARDRHPIKREITKHEWQLAFGQTHHFAAHEPAFLRSLGAYRKTLLQENIVERWLLLGRALVVLATDKQPGVAPLDAIASCGSLLWGNEADWPHLSQVDTSLEDLYQLLERLHTRRPPLGPETMLSVLETYETLHKFTHAFLTEWRNQHIDIPGEFFHARIHMQTTWNHILQ
jgi:hypothetical protein